MSHDAHTETSTTHPHAHHHACDCAAHRAPAANGSVWATILPFVACLVCPACLTTYAKVFSIAGVGFGLSETHHLIALVLALGLSLAVSAWRTYKSGRAWPIGIAVTATSLVAVGHFAGDMHELEWAGVLMLLVGGLSEQFRLRVATPPQQART